jgi:hypothetical protein
MAGAFGPIYLGKLASVAWPQWVESCRVKFEPAGLADSEHRRALADSAADRAGRRRSSKLQCPNMAVAASRLAAA